MNDPAIPAASLILMRDQPGGSPEILMVRRGDRLAFGAGAYAFPGGRIDPPDREMARARHRDLDPDDAAARIAAIRETLEETGVGARALEQGTRWLHPEHLVPFARWYPPEQIVRRFDTRFYLAEATGDHDPVADGTETADAFWATPADVFARCAAGDGRVLFPTRCLLERIGRFARFAEAAAEARALPARIISPWIEERADGRWLCIPGDAGYPVTAERIDTAMRH